MIHHLLVALDGSAAAEAALGPAQTLARTLGARITLMHVVERNAPKSVHGQPHLGSPGEAEAYLRGLSGRLPGVEVSIHVHAGEGGSDVARGIRAHQSEMDHDLIVMAAHGRGAARTLLLGSLPQRVTRGGAVPVLIVPAESRRPFACRSILLALDDRSEHAGAVTFVTELARGCPATLHLVTTVPTYGTLGGGWHNTSRLLPATTTRLLEMALPGAEELLRSERRRLESAGITVTHRVARGDPARAIRRAAGALAVDMIALGTHGRSGIGALWEGSVAARVCRSCAIPLLLVPVGGQG